MKTQPKIKFTAMHRILHWAIAFLMSVLFATGFLRMYWMSKATIIDAVQTNLNSKNISLEISS